MGRYGPPHFAAMDEDVVSIWATKGALADMPENYFEVNYGGGDDEPWNTFSNDFGFGSYDDDFVEANCTEDWRTVPIGELLEPLSDSLHFKEAAIRLAEQAGLGSTCYVKLLYHFRYNPEATGVRESKYMKFIGTFSYDRDK